MTASSTSSSIVSASVRNLTMQERIANRPCTMSFDWNTLPLAADPVITVPTSIT